MNAGRYLVEQYMRRNLADSATVNPSDDNVYGASATDAWSLFANAADKKVSGTIRLMYKKLDGKNDVYGPLYYVVELKEKVRHLFMPGWFDPMDAPVRAVALLRPHYRGLIEPMQELERTKVVANWEYADKYKGSDDVYSGKWNHYMAGTDSDKMAVKYEKKNPYRTESVRVNTAERNKQTNPDSDGQKTRANTPGATKASEGTFYSKEEVDSINIDFQAEIRKKFSTDWDLGQVLQGQTYSQTSNNSWSLGNGDDKRILFNVEFNESFPTRDPSKRADPLWVRIESDPIKNPYTGAGVEVFNSVRQITLNFNTDNTQIAGSGENQYYENRPYVIFYTGPENIDYKTDSKGVLLRHSQPVVLNLNEDLNAIVYMPESPVIINGNGKNWHGFIIAKCFLKSVTSEEMEGENPITLYDGFNEAYTFPARFEELTDGYGNTVYVRSNELTDLLKLEDIPEPSEEATKIEEDGTISYYEKIEATQYLLLEYTKDDHNTYAVTEENGKLNEAKTFVAYINATYKEKFKTFSGLNDSQISAVSFPPDEVNGTPKYNETTAVYYVATSDLLNYDPDPYAVPKDDVYVEVRVGDEVKYIEKTKLPYVKVRTNKDYFYVCVYDLKLAWDGATVNNNTSYSGVRMIDNSFTDEQIEASYGTVKNKGIKTATNEYKGVNDNATASDADIYINPNDKWCDSWGIEKNLISVYKSKWKKDKLDFSEQNGSKYFMLKEEIANLNKTNPSQRISCYRKVIVDDEEKYIDENKTEYYMKVYNNATNLDNYIIVDKNGNMLTKPVTSPDVLGKTTVAENVALMAQAETIGNKALSDYWNVYTRAPNSDEIPGDEGEATLDGRYVGQSEYRKDEDYRIPVLERVYEMSTFNLGSDSYYSYFDIEVLWRVNYLYLNVDEFNHTVNREPSDKWKVVDMFFTKERAAWID